MAKRQTQPASRVQLIGYLERRHQVLAQLDADLHCEPFLSKAPTRLSVLVDWSEVYAYIMRGRAPDDPSADAVLGDDLLQSSHQAALNVLFERLQIDLPLVLPPPYIREMQAYVTRVRESIAAAHSTDLDTVADRLFAHSEVYQQLRAFVDQKYGTSRKTRKKGLLIADLESSFSSEDVHRFRQWLNTEFGGLYLLATVWYNDSMKSLRRLIEGSQNEAPRLQSLRDVEPQLHGILRSLPDRVHRWDTRLFEADRHKRASSRLVDAEALDLITRLNVELGVKGHQVLFVTRSADIISSTSGREGLFACCSHIYRRTLSEAPPLLFRDWQYFFELGVVLSTNRAQMLQELARRRKSVSEQLEGLRSNQRSIGNVQRQQRSDARKSLHNKEIFLSVHRPKLERVKVNNDIDGVLKYFIEFVTSNAKFETERLRIRDEVGQELNDVRSSFLWSAVDTGFHAFETVDSRSVFRMLVQRLPISLITPAQKGYVKRFRDSLRLVKEASSAATPQADARPALTHEASLAAQLLECISAFRMGLPRRLRGLLEDIDSRLLRACSSEWLMYHALTADALHATERSRDAVVRYFDTHVGNVDLPIVAHADDCIRLIAVLNSWLAAHLNVHYPRHGGTGDDLPAGDGVQALKHRKADRIMSQILAVERSITELDGSVPTDVQRAIANNMVYSWSAGVLGVLGRETKQNGFEGLRNEAQRQSDLFNIVGRAALLRRYLTKGAEADTYGFYQLVCAILAGPLTANGQQILKRSLQAFEHALRGDKRTQLFASAHMADARRWIVTDEF